MMRIKCKLEAVSTKANTFLSQTGLYEVALQPRNQGNLIGKDRVPTNGATKLAVSMD